MGKAGPGRVQPFAVHLKPQVGLQLVLTRSRLLPFAILGPLNLLGKTATTMSISRHGMLTKTAAAKSSGLMAVCEQQRK